jgi:serine/threonine protein kinase
MLLETQALRYRDSRNQFMNNNMANRSIISGSAESVLVFDPDTKYVLDANASCLALMEYSIEEIKQLQIYDLTMHSRTEVDLYTEQVVCDGEMSLGTRRWRTKSGRELEIALSVNRITMQGQIVIFTSLQPIQRQSINLDGLSLFPVPQDIIADRYRILSELGRGSMGSVFKVEDLELEEIMAMKVMNPMILFDSSEDELASRFKRELKLARRISHKNVCNLYDFGTSGVLKFVTMAYIEGRELRQILEDRNTSLSIEQKRDIFTGILDGLEAAHAQGIIHRDLKPENIMIATDGQPVIMDFGIAYDVSSMRLTQSGKVLGTPLYMSPEQCLGKMIDLRTDIYSLGVIAYEMCSGHLPFSGSNFMDIAMKHIEQPPIRPSLINQDIPPKLDDIILKMMEKDPNKRFQSVSEIKKALQPLFKGHASKILVADDDPDFRDLLTFSLRSRGYEVAIAEDGLQAVERAMECKPDLICLDMHMPHFDGFRVVEILKTQEKTSDIPILILTSFDDKQYMSYGRSMGVKDYLLKTPNLQAVIDCMEEHL